MAEMKIQNAIDESRNDISNLDDALMMEVVGVAEAIDRLKKALDQLDVCLDNRDFDAAANLGYQEIAANFIFLQRTLGGLQQQANKKSELISDIAIRSGAGAYEVVAPFVEELLQSSKPLTPGQKKKNKKTTKKHKKTFQELYTSDE